jgi:hypothetical protein
MSGTPSQDTAPVQTSFRWMAACIVWRLGFKQSSFHHIPRVPRHPAPVRLGTATAFLACSGPLHLSDPGKPSDPGTSLRVPPGCTGDTTGRLAAQRSCRDWVASAGRAATTVRAHLPGRCRRASRRTFVPMTVRRSARKFEQVGSPSWDHLLVRRGDRIQVTAAQLLRIMMSIRTRRRWAGVCAGSGSGRSNVGWTNGRATWRENFFW